MGTFGKLFEKSPSEKLFETIMPLVEITQTLGVFDNTMQNQRKRKIVLCYFLGFVDFVGQAQEIPKEEIMEVAGRIFRKAFELSEEETEKALECVIEASQESEGRQYITAGAMALADFMSGKRKTTNLPLMTLLNTAEEIQNP